MRPYPLMMNLQNNRVIVIGGGRVAFRKTTGLLDSGAQVVVISPKLIPEMERLRDQEKIEWKDAHFHESILDDYRDAILIFGTTDDRQVNLQIYNAAYGRRLPCNIADVPDLCTFIVPAVISQGDLMIAVSTGGASPALARKIREELEKQYGPEYGKMTKLMGDLRKRVLNSSCDSDENRKLFSEIVDSELLEAIRQSDFYYAMEILKKILPMEIDVENAVGDSCGDQL